MKKAFCDIKEGDIRLSCIDYDFIDMDIFDGKLIEYNNGFEHHCKASIHSILTGSFGIQRLGYSRWNKTDEIDIVDDNDREFLNSIYNKFTNRCKMLYHQMLQFSWLEPIYYTGYNRLSTKLDYGDIIIRPLGTEMCILQLDKGDYNHTIENAFFNMSNDEFDSISKKSQFLYTYNYGNKITVADNYCHYYKTNGSISTYMPTTSSDVSLFKATQQFDLESLADEIMNINISFYSALRPVAEKYIDIKNDAVYRSWSGKEINYKDYICQ